MCKLFRLLALSTSCILLAGLLAACSGGTDTSSAPEDASSAADSSSTTSKDDSSSNSSDAETPFEKSLAVAGANGRIASVMKKAQEGKPIVLGVIGGSITAGASADAGKAYADLVTAWWKEKFPGVTFMPVNAGIGATDSIYGAHRAQNDLLGKNPDFVIVEFSVNDRGGTNTQEAYEGLMRQILQSKNTPGVLALALCGRDGSTWQDKHEPICENYQIPMISFKDAYYAEVSSGKDPSKTLDTVWADAEHPTTMGHQMIADLIIEYLEGVYASLDNPEEAVTELADPVTANGYENANIYTSQTLQASSNAGWTVSGTNWMSTTPNASIKFDVTGGYITMYYKRTVNVDKAGKVKVVIDGDTANAVTVDSSFAGGWGDYYASIDLLHDSEAGAHTVEIIFDESSAAGSEFVISNMCVANS